MSDLLSFAPSRAWDANGVPVPGALARFFVSGSTDPAPVFADAALAVPHPVPLVADAAGHFPPVYHAGGQVQVELRAPDGTMLPGGTIVRAMRAGAGATAASISFAPTGTIPATNAQEAIERVQTNIGTQLAAVGFGITGTAPDLPGFDATNVPAGTYRVTSATPGTRPDGMAGASGVAEMLRSASNEGVLEFHAGSPARSFRRRLSGGAWGAWNEMIHDGRAVDQAAWQAGSSAQLGPASPALVRGAFNAAGAAPVFACRAWANFNGTTQAIRGSGNVAGITRNAAGDYTVTFTTALEDANYCAVISATNRDAFSFPLVGQGTSTNRAAGFVRFLTLTAGGVPEDVTDISVAIFR